MNRTTPAPEDVIREFPPLGKYRIRLSDRAQVELLRDVCSEALRDLLL